MNTRIASGTGVVAALLVGMACGDGFESELDTDRRGPLDAGSTGDGGRTEPAVACPEDPPKIGEPCPRMFDETDLCSYSAGECTSASGAVYQESITYCCFMRLWAVCGTTNACAGLPAEPDAGTAVDSREPDAARDVAVDRTPDASAPDASEPDAGAPDSDAEGDAVEADAGEDGPASSADTAADGPSDAAADL